MNNEVDNRVLEQLAMKEQSRQMRKQYYLCKSKQGSN